MLVVGAGPAGSAAATWAARSGLEVTLADAAAFPRDKSCGDGLTPRAMGELDRLGLGAWTRQHTVNEGLRAHGFGQVLELPWPGGSLPAYGSAVARTELDDQLRRTAPDGGRPAAAARQGGRRGPDRRPRTRGRLRRRRRPTGGALRPAGGRRRGPLPARSGARPAVAPRHRLRGRRPGVPRLRAGGPLDLLPPRAARARRGAAVGLRLDLPAGRRPGEPGRRHPGHGEAAGRMSRCGRCWSTTRVSAARSGSSGRPCGCRPRPCCPWAVRSAGWPDPTGR